MGGEVVSRAEELLELFVLTLERRQPQQTYAHACRRFVRWLGRGPGPRTSRSPAWSQDLKTTMVYGEVEVDAGREERQLLRFAGGRLPLEEEP